MFVDSYARGAAKNRAMMIVLGVLLAGFPAWSQSKASGMSEKLVPYSGSDRILEVDQARKAVVVSLAGAEGGANFGMNFNGYGSGKMVIRVPLGWEVTLSLVVDSPLKHSALVVPWEKRQAGELTPAFPGSDPKDYRVGFGKGSAREQYTFAADKAGRYAIVCGVPGHAQIGMWDEFDVAADAAAPEVLIRG